MLHKFQKLDDKFIKERTDGQALIKVAVILIKL